MRAVYLRSARLLLVLSTVIGGGVASAAAPGREYYVDSRTGSDEAPGTQDRPLRSLAAVGRLSLRPGDKVLFVCGSAFEGGFVVNQSGTTEAPITFEATGSGPAPRFTNPHAAVLQGNAIRLNASHIIVDGLFFERCPTNPIALDVRTLGAVFLTTNANYDTVRNCEITQTPIGVNVYGQHNLITHNFVHDNNAPIQPHWGPLCVMVCNSHNEVSYNRFVNYCAPSQEYGHDGGAVEIHDRALPKEDISIHHNLSLRNQGFIEWVGRVRQDGFLIHHNVCMDYQSFLGFTGPCTNIRVEHNTVVRILAHVQADSEDVVFWRYYPGNTNISFCNNIFVYDPARVEPMFARGEPDHAYNLFFRTDQATIPKQANREAYQRKYLGGGAQLRTGDKFGDPLFRDLANGDFRLKPGSPALGAGTNLHYSLDFDNRPLPAQAAPDLGAFQCSPGSK